MSKLPPNFIRAIQRASKELETIAVLELDGGNVTVSETSGHGTPILQRVSRFLHKIEPSHGKANLAKVSIDLMDRDEWGSIVSQKYLKNRRINLKIGPRGGGMADFYTIFTGLIVDFDIKENILALEAQDDLYVTKKRVPVENATKTQSLAFQNTNPMDIKKTLIETHGEVPNTKINSTQFDADRDAWLQNWAFDRVLTNPIAIKKLINELDEQTLSFTFTDGDQITSAVFAPPVPGESILEIENEYRRETLNIKGGMEDNLCNLCVIYYDWNESGSESEDDFDGVILVSDSASQGTSEWDEVARRAIKSKWIRTRSIAQPTNITGAVIYHVNSLNAAGTATLSYNSAAQTLTYTSPGDSAGSAVTVNRDGKYQLFSNDTTKYIRVVVTVGSLPGSNKSDSLAVTAINGVMMATILATHTVARYRDPQAELIFDLNLSDAIWLDQFLKVSDIIKITDDRIITKGRPKWDDERIFLTSVKPDYRNKRMKIEGIQTSFKKRYGFIAPTGNPTEYDNASLAEREYAYIADAGGTVGTAGDAPYYIW